MRILKKLIVTLRTDVKIIFCISLAFTLIYELILTNYSSYNESVYKLGIMFNRLGLSILSSTIFYFFIVHVKDQTNKKLLYDAINHKLQQIIDIKHSLLDIIRSNVNDQNTNPMPGFNELESILNKIDPLKQPIGTISLVKNGNWGDYLFGLNTLTKSHIKSIFDKKLDDPELIKRLANLEDCIYLNYLDTQYSLGYLKEDLSIITSNLIDYFGCVIHLENYYYAKIHPAIN